MNKDKILKLKDGLFQLEEEYVDINLLNDKFDYRDLKAIMFIDKDSFKENKLNLKFKDKIDIKLNENIYNIDDVVILKLGNNIGKGIIKEKTSIDNDKMTKYIIKPTEVYINGKYETSLFKLFKIVNKNNQIFDYENTNENISNIFKNLVNSNFRLYYYALIEHCKNINGANKYSGIASYLGLKNYIKYLNSNVDNKEKVYISPPNCYIKGTNVEYDALLIKENSNDKYLYNEDEVLAIIEIKTSGLICKKDDLKEAYNEMINREKYNNIPFKYIAFHEFKDSYEKYNEQVDKVDQIFLTLKGKSTKTNINEDCGNTQFILLENFSIDKLLKNL